MKLFKLFLLSIGLINILFVGCGKSNSQSQPTAIDSSESTITSDENAIMAPSPTTLKAITSSIATILEIDIQTQNKKEATTFTKEMFYCDISGMKEYKNIGNSDKMTKNEKFNACTNEQNTQDGTLSIEYENMDNDDKFPELLTLTVAEDYTFNDILLQKGTVIKSTIIYNADKSIQSIDLDITGTVSYLDGTYELKNTKETIRF